jgi:hypothetical protein
LLDAAFRETLLPNCRQTEVRAFWRDVFPNASEQQRSSVGALLRRMDKLLSSEVVRYLVAQEQPTFCFSDAIERRLIVLAPIPHVAFGPLAATAAMLMFQALLRAAFERPGTAQTRRNYPLIVDEFQVLVEHGATQDVAAALSQLRSQGIPAIYAHQSLGQIGELANLMLVNAENRVLLRTQEPDASVYARQYATSGVTAADIAGQEPNEHQYARFTCAGVSLGPFSMAPLPWPKETPAVVATYAGPDWQLVVPADLPQAGTPPELLERDQALRDYDGDLCRIIHKLPPDEARYAILAACAEDEWRLLNDRWVRIAHAQRRFILAHPGSVPDRFERVRWLSRLAYARPRLIAEAEYRRARAVIR